MERVLSVRRSRSRGNGRRRGLSLSDLPPRDAVYIERARLLTNRPRPRDFGNLDRHPRSAARHTLRRLLAIAGRLIFYTLLAVWCGIGFGLALDLILKATR